MPTHQEITRNLASRKVVEDPPCLRGLEIPAADMVNIALNLLYVYSRGDSPAMLAELATSIGQQVLHQCKQPKDSGRAAKIGVFILYSFEDIGLTKLETVIGKRHITYAVTIVLLEVITKLWEALPSEKTDKMPLFKPFPPWETCYNSEERLIKTSNKGVLRITAETHPLVFECVNRAQKVGWMINRNVYQTAAWAFRDKQCAFDDIWNLADREARASKTRETKTVLAMARKVKNRTFYHRYYLDFRGRKYPATAYLHEQGSDLAGALLLRDEGKPLGEVGYFWLRVCIASNWGNDAGRADGLKTDKLPLADRAAWVDRHEGQLLTYAALPREHLGWMKADKPWKFLADCMELYKLRQWQQRNLTAIKDGTIGRYDYVSCREGFIDGTTNGSQHLTALTRDEVTAEHVNLVPSAYPGDLYKYVGEHVWDYIHRELATFTTGELEAARIVLSELQQLKWSVQNAPPKSEERAAKADVLRAFKEEHAEIVKVLPPVFWAQIVDSKHKRKIVKRNVMTIPYGGTKYGLGQQCIDDARKHGIDLLNNMEHRWGAYMGRVVYEDCKTSLQRPMQLLKVFEDAGKAAELRDEFLSWKVPATGFPVVQHYTQGVVKKVWINYGPTSGPRVSTGKYDNTLQIQVCFKELHEKSKHKQASGAAPNIIHSLDAAHLMLTQHMCSDFEITTIHDSYGTLYCDMDKLYINVRRAFVRLYQHEPLESIMEQIGGDLSAIDIGVLNIMAMLDSEYCFS